MTQRIFDIENEKDMADLWDILPEEIKTIYKDSNGFPVYFTKSPEIDGVIPSPVGIFKINWHDKTEITRPIQEATEDKPQVGDIWETDLHICYIVKVADNTVEFIFRSKPYYDGIKYQTATCSDNFFKALWQFKCKSKTSLENLFKGE